jgi:hypothetical protein
MPDLDKLRDLTQQVRPPPFESLAGTARRRDRRTAALAAGCAAVLVTVFGGALLQHSDERSTPQPARPAPDASGDVRAVPASGEASLPRGRYSLRVTPTLGYEVDLPGRRYVDDGTFLHHPDAKGVFLVTAAPADGTFLPRHPCTDKSSVTVGPTPRAMSRALSAQPVLDVRATSPIRLDGATGVFLEVRVPPGFDASVCQDVGETRNDLMLFGTTEGTTWTWPPGYVGHWWILDVGGERVVVMNACDQTCTAKDLRTLRTMTESVTFSRSAE